MILFKRFALITALVASLVGCTQSDEPMPVRHEDNSRFSLRLNVQVNSSGASSRADKGPEDFEPLPGEGFEEIATLRVIIFNPDGITLKGNRKVQMSLINDKLVPVNDNLIFPVESNELLYVYLIANETSLPVPTSVNTGGYTSVGDWLDSYLVNNRYEDLRGVLNGWTAGYSAQGAVSGWLFYNGEASRLPLTERFRLLTDQNKAIIADNGTSDDGLLIVEYIQEATLFMTPAAAKMTFEFDFKKYTQGGFEGVSGANVTGIRFSGLGQTEYVFPTSTVYNPAKYTSAGEDGGIINPAENRYITSFAVPANNGSIALQLQGDNFKPVSMTYPSTDLQRGPYYFPETISQLESEAFKVEVQIDGDRWLPAQPLKDNILKFDGHEAIARATHLRITIYFTDFDIKWEAVEAPYNSVQLDPVFGLTDEELEEQIKNQNKNNND